MMIRQARGLMMRTVFREVLFVKRGAFCTLPMSLTGPSR
ncbi:Unknown protein sequence [Pseudomonas syringae pv. aceris]|nr:Unknown protein sequence [Pseudomonas syringae pv. aceris]